MALGSGFQVISLTFKIYVNSGIVIGPRPSLVTFALPIHHQLFVKVKPAYIRVRLVSRVQDFESTLCDNTLLKSVRIPRIGISKRSYFYTGCRNDVQKHAGDDVHASHTGDTSRYIHCTFSKHLKRIAPTDKSNATKVRIFDANTRPSLLKRLRNAVISGGGTCLIELVESRGFMYVHPFLCSTHILVLKVLP